MVSSSSEAADRHCRGGWFCCAASCLSQGVVLHKPSLKDFVPHCTKSLYKLLVNYHRIALLAELSLLKDQQPSAISPCHKYCYFWQKVMLFSLWNSKTTWGEIMASKVRANLGLICITWDKNKKNVLCSPQICVELNNFYLIVNFSPRSPINI